MVISPSALGAESQESHLPESQRDPPEKKNPVATWTQTHRFHWEKYKVKQQKTNQAATPMSAGVIRLKYSDRSCSACINFPVMH